MIKEIFLRITLFVSFALTIASISGCATVKESYSADGRKAYTLNCSGTARGWDKCYAAAGELCQTKGYEILDRTSEDAGGIVGNSQGIYGAKTNERTMLVACKK